MDTWIEETKRRLESTRKQLQGVSAKRIALAEEERVLTEKLRSYEVLLRDDSLPHETAEGPIASEIPNPDKIPVSQFVANFIKKSNGTGITHADIRAALSSNGYTPHRNYPYVVVGHLREEKKVVERRGKLFWNEQAAE
jgi:hypothetical protein